MNGSIYIIRNTVNEKVYIGQTIQTVERRFKGHLSGDPRRHNQAILWAMEKLGRENFYVETLATGIETVEELDALEEKYIQEYNSMKPNGYNLCPGGCKWRNSKTANVVLDQTLVDDYLSGMSLRAVAEKHNCSTNKVKYHVRLSGAKLRAKQNEFSQPRATKTDDAVLERLFLEENRTDVEVSEILGITEDWIQKRRRQLGIYRIKNPQECPTPTSLYYRKG